MLALLALLPPPPAPDAAIPVALPPASPVALGPARDYRVTVRKEPRPREDVATVRGRRVVFKPDAEFDRVSVSAVGADGTVALYRSYYGNYTTFRETIWRGGTEAPVTALGHAAQISDYRDARNYAGWFYEDEPQNSSTMTPPSDESVAFVVEDGRVHTVGRGRVVAWNRGGAVATLLTVDAEGNPAGYEVGVSERVRVLEPDGRNFDLGRVRCLGRRADGAFAFASTDGLYFWHKGLLRPWVRLPEGWEPLAFEPKGSLLARNGGTAGILRGRVLTPVRATNPRAAEALANADRAEWLHPDGAFAVAEYDLHGAPTVYALRPR